MVVGVISHSHREVTWHETNEADEVVALNVANLGGSRYFWLQRRRRQRGLCPRGGMQLNRLRPRRVPSLIRKRRANQPPEVLRVE